MSEHLKVRLITFVFCGLQYPDEACCPCVLVPYLSMFAAEGSQSILLHYKYTFLMSQSCLFDNVSLWPPLSVHTELLF